MREWVWRVMSVSERTRKASAHRSLVHLLRMQVMSRFPRMMLQEDGNAAACALVRIRYPPPWGVQVTSAVDAPWAVWCSGETKTARATAKRSGRWPIVAVRVLQSGRSEGEVCQEGELCQESACGCECMHARTVHKEQEGMVRTTTTSPLSPLLSRLSSRLSSRPSPPLASQARDSRTGESVWRGAQGNKHKQTKRISRPGC